MANTIVLPLNSGQEFSRGTTGTPGIAPDPVLLLPGDELLTVSWAINVDGLGYRIYYATSPITDTSAAGVSRVVVNDPELGETEITGLTNGTLYYVRMVTVYPAGYSALTIEKSREPSAFANTLSTSFDGATEYLDGGTPAELQFNRTDPFTFNFWIKPDLSGGEKAYISTEVDGSNDIGYVIRKDAGQRFEVQLRQALGDRLRTRTAETHTLDTWQMISVTYDGSGNASGCLIYIDGTLATMEIQNDTLVSDYTFNNFTVSARPNGTDFYSGLMDEISVYNAELSAVEILELYNSGAPGNLVEFASQPDLVSWWRMGENSNSTTITDVYGSNDLTLVNMDSSNYVEDVP